VCAHSKVTIKAIEAAIKKYGADNLRIPFWEPRLHVVPTDKIPILRRDADGSKSIDAVRWGLIPKWAPSLDAIKGAAMFNAKSETIAELRSFKEPFRTKRCIVIVDGWYEWVTTGKKQKTPFHIHKPDMEPLMIAGLWEAWTSKDGEVIESATMVTRATVGPMTRLHTRMPIVLDDDAIDPWLDRKNTEPLPLLKLLEESFFQDFVIEEIASVPDASSKPPAPQLKLFS
jgi:putative SOS response-associated peptidase YedK